MVRREEGGKEVRCENVLPRLCASQLSLPRSRTPRGPVSPPTPQCPSPTFWILGCMREGQGGIWLRAAVISWDSTAARALQMAMTDWITRSAFSGKSPWRAEGGLTGDPRAAQGTGLLPAAHTPRTRRCTSPCLSFPSFHTIFLLRCTLRAPLTKRGTNPQQMRQGGPKNAPSIPSAHLGCQESIHLVVEGVKEETEGLPGRRGAELSPSQVGTQHGGSRSRCDPPTC